MMNVEYFRQKQMQLEKQLKKINIGIVVLVVGVSVFALGVIIFAAFILDGVDVLTEKALPVLINPFTLMFVSLMFIFVVLYDRKIFDKLKKEM